MINIAILLIVIRTEARNFSRVGWTEEISRSARGRTYRRLVIQNREAGSL